MKVRPTSVTVICWILLVMGIMSAAGTLMNINNPLVKESMSRGPFPLPVQYVLLALGIGVMIICGAAMLKGQNWARYLYVGWTGVALFISLWTTPVKAALLPGFVLYAVAVFILFRPRARDFFAKRDGTEGTASVP